MKLFGAFLFVFSFVAQAATIEKDLPAKVELTPNPRTCQYTLSHQFNDFPLVRAIYVSFGNCSEWSGSCNEVGFRLLSQPSYIMRVLGTKPPYTLSIPGNNGNGGSVTEWIDQGDCKPRTFKIFLEQ